MSTYDVLEVTPDGTLAPSTRPLVDPAPGQVRLRVEACGVCHTDVFTVRPHARHEPSRVPGHEVVGVVDALGDGVSGWSVGQRVGVGYLGGQCGVCDACRRGNFVACSDQPVTGSSVDGGYAEVAYARASGLVAVPDELTSAEAAPLLCAGFTVYNALLKAGVRAGDLVAVQGIGGLGHLGLQYAARMGLRVVAIARGRAKEEQARSFGARYYLDAVADDVAAELRRLGGARVVVATAAAGDSTSALLGGLAHGGHLMVLGAGDQPIAVPALSLIFGDAVLEGSLTGRAIENEDNLRFAVDQGIRGLVEERPLAGAAEAFDRMLSGQARFRMVLTTG